MNFQRTLTRKVEKKPELLNDKSSNSIQHAKTMPKFVEKPIENADLSFGQKWIKKSHTREIGKFM